MEEHRHPGGRFLAASLLGAIGYPQIPFGFFLVVSEPLPGAPGSRVEGIMMIVVGTAMLWSAFRVWPRYAQAIQETDTVRSLLRALWWLVGLVIVVLAGVGFAGGGFAAIPSAPWRDVVAALGGIGLAVAMPAIWLLRMEYRNLRRAKALDDHGATATGRIIRLSDSSMVEWVGVMGGPPNTRGGYHVTYTFNRGVPTMDSVDGETYKRLRVGDRFTLVYLPEDLTVSRSA